MSDAAGGTTGGTRAKAAKSDLKATAASLVGTRLADVERELVLATMARCGGNRTFAADMLGVAAADLRDLLLEYRRATAAHEEALASREAELAADRHRGEAPRATYVPSPLHLA